MIRILFGRSFLNVNDGVSPGFAPIAGGGSQLFVATEAFASYKWPIASTWNRLTVTLYGRAGRRHRAHVCVPGQRRRYGPHRHHQRDATTATVTSAVATAAGDSSRCVARDRLAGGSDLLVDD